MTHLRNRSVLFVIKIICLASANLTTAVQAETLVESSLLSRVYLAFRVDQKATRAWLPSPWKAASLPKGPFKGDNLLVIFSDKLITQDGEEKLIKGGTYCHSALVAFGKNEQTGEFAPFDIRAYWPHDDPGPYKVGVKAKVFREATLQSANLGAKVREAWIVQDSAGGIMEFSMDYQRAVPKRTIREIRVRSSVEPDFFRIYRDDYAHELVKSIPAGIDRVKNYKFTVTMSALIEMFDGSEQLVGISVNPIRMRQVFLP